MKFTIPNERISRHNESKAAEFPKYTSQLINWANQNAQGRGRLPGAGDCRTALISVW